jgi:hypothetical protein
LDCGQITLTPKWTWNTRLFGKTHPAADVEY